MKEKVEDKFGRAKKSLQASEKNTHCVSLMSPYEFLFNASKEGDQWFSQDGSIPATFFTQESWYFSLQLENFPLPGILGVLTLFFGYAEVTFVPVSEVTKAGCTIESLPQYLEGLSADDLSNFTVFGLMPGQSCFFPMGYIPVILGIGGDGEDYNHDYICYLIQYCLDKSSIGSLPHDDRLEIYTSVTKTCSRRGGPFSKDQVCKPLKAYLSMLQPSV